MPAAAQQNDIDGRQAAQLVGLLDSPVDAEAAGALHKIRVLKKKHGDVPFYELVERPDYKAAIWEKFGAPECLKEHMEAAALIGKLRSDNAQLEHDGAALAADLGQKEEIITELRGELAARPLASSSDTGLVNGGLVAIVALIALALMIAAALQ